MPLSPILNLKIDDVKRQGTKTNGISLPFPVNIESIA